MVQHKGVHVQQVLLQVIHRGELLVAALAHVLRGGGGVVHRQVLQQGLL